MIKKQRNIGWWIVGIFYLLLSIGVFTDSFFGGILMIVGGLIALPPFNKWLKDKYNLKIATWIKIIALVLILIISMNLATKGTGEDTKQPESSQKVSEPVVSQVERKVSILAEKEKTELCSQFNGVLILVSVYDKDGNCDWINGHAKIILKDSSGAVVETKEKDLSEKDIMLGSSCMTDFPDIILNDLNKLDKIKSAVVEYTAANNKKYTDTVEVTEPFDYCISQTNNQENIELSDELKKLSVKIVLEQYGYSVIKVEDLYDNIFGDYAGVGMYAGGNTEIQIAAQIGAGFGALYGVYPDEDYYMVSLNNYVNICGFGIDDFIMKRYISGELSGIQLLSSIDSTCAPVN